ncbi:TetR/AcrR family transcriptional regulator [Paraburkholderia sp. MPAMCS5]|uniref:TetR/AcrR family transcriptional regulator n=1 Tax=Paraburkholderia sp. MPAMCS5 TaxID=3112563 RepID=UPI002E17A6F6|nr:TetR/AcrR family transcriptional regulator [Paraburkholderia sp. MPAMCS5]
MTVSPPRPSADKLRRTQAARSESMRRRLLDATLQSLAVDGYAGSSLNSIVKLAGVSRGAQTHHFPSKQALILEAADSLMRRAYRTFGKLVLSISDERDRHAALLDAMWKRLFDTPLFRAYLELVIASQRDPELADALRKLLRRARDWFEPAVDHYFETDEKSTVKASAVILQQIMLLTSLVMQAHLLPGAGLLKEQFRTWLELSAAHIRPRAGVRTAPPRPLGWDDPMSLK